MAGWLAGRGREGKVWLGGGGVAGGGGQEGRLGEVGVVGTIAG